MTLQSVADLVSKLKLETFEKKDEVITYGSQGDKFYLILEGKVEIKIPDPSQTEKFEKVGKEIDNLTMHLEGLNEKIRVAKNFLS